MEIAVFAKKRMSADGKHFYIFLSTLTRKDGIKQTVTVKFRNECEKPKPEKCPMNIKFDKSTANLSTREFVWKDTGDISTSFTLWISAWEPGAPFVDHSLDDFV